MKRSHLKHTLVVSILVLAPACMLPARTPSRTLVLAGSPSHSTTVAKKHHHKKHHKTS